MDCYTKTFGCIRDNNIVRSKIVKACIKNGDELVLKYDIDDPVELEYYKNIQDEQVKVKDKSVIIKYFLHSVNNSKINNDSNNTDDVELNNYYNSLLWFSRKNSTIRSISPKIIELRSNIKNDDYNIERYRLNCSTRKDNKAIRLNDEKFYNNYMKRFKKFIMKSTGYLQSHILNLY